MSTKFYTLLTDIGAAKLASAAALGVPLKITHMAVGDGGGTLPTPDAKQTALVNEKRRAALNMLYIDPQNSSQIIAEQVIPENEGGWWIREVGLFDESGALIAVGNCPESYKPQLAEGSGRTQTVRMVLITSSTDNITLKIDPAVVLATRKYVDDKTLELKVYVDDQMAKHLAAADPHSQYAPKASPIFTGTPKAPTPAAGNNTTQLATTAFVQAALTALINGAPATLDTLKEIAAAINNDPKFSTTINNALALKAPLSSPALTGTPTAPTAAMSVNNTQIATTAFVKSAIAGMVGSAPAALDTLNELAAALGNDQNTDLQRNALNCAGCERIFEDKISGTKSDRPGLKKLLRTLSAGDTLVVWKLDRLGRSMRHLVTLIEELRQRGVNFRSLTDSIDTSTPMGRFFFHVMGALAEMERELIVERTRAGLAAARAKGRVGGRRPKLTTEQWAQIGRLLEAGESRQRIALIFDVGVSTIYRKFPANKSNESP